VKIIRYAAYDFYKGLWNEFFIMWKKSYVFIFIVFALFVSACLNFPSIQAPHITSQSIAKTNTSTAIPATASPVPTSTPAISAAFMAMLATETSMVTPTYVTPLPVTGTPQPGVTERVSIEDEERLKKIIREYFDRRYYAFSLSNLDGIPDNFIDDLLSDAPETSVFLELELAKLRMTLNHRELNDLKYSAYEYFLDYENISFDSFSQTATVSLSKKDNTIFEISAMLASGEPIMSSYYNEEHTIVMRKEESGWKIVSDTYRDYVWRMLRKSDPSPAEILNTLDLMLQNQEAAPRPSSLDCFSGSLSSPFSLHDPERKNPPTWGFIDTYVPIHPKVRLIFHNGKYHDPEWSYSNPFTNLYFQPDGNSQLRFIVELDNISLNQFLSHNTYPEISGWQIIIYSPLEDKNVKERPTLVLDLDQKISCDSRPAFFAETSLEEIQEELGNQRVFDYQIVNGKGDIQLEHSLYLNPSGGYLISDTFGDVRGLDGGIIGYPNLIGEIKAVFPRAGRVITVHEPRGGFCQLQYFAKPAIRWYSGLWTEETPYEIIIQVFLYRDDGVYQPEQAYTFPEHRKIKGRRSYDFRVSFTFDELKDALGHGNEFYVRFLDQDGNIVGEDYFYFIPYTQPTP
jgi:hypothetical protein